MGGQKLRASKVLMLGEKLKQKKFQKRLFLDFVFKLKNIPIFLKKNKIKRLNLNQFGFKFRIGELFFKIFFV